MYENKTAPAENANIFVSVLLLNFIFNEEIKKFPTAKTAIQNKQKFMIKKKFCIFILLAVYLLNEFL